MSFWSASGCSVSSLRRRLMSDAFSLGSHWMNHVVMCRFTRTYIDCMPAAPGVGRTRTQSQLWSRWRWGWEVHLCTCDTSTPGWTRRLPAPPAPFSRLSFLPAPSAPEFLLPLLPASPLSLAPVAGKNHSPLLRTSFPLRITPFIFQESLDFSPKGGSTARTGCSLLCGLSYQRYTAGASQRRGDPTKRTQVQLTSSASGRWNPLSPEGQSCPFTQGEGLDFL